MRASLSSVHRAGWFAIASVACVACIGCTGVIGSATPGSGGGTGTGATTGAAGATGAGATTGAAGATGTGATTGTAGATGVIVDPTVAACAASNNALNAGLTPARRLTRDEFNNTVRELVGATGSPADDLGDDERIGPFRSNAIIPLDELQVQKQSEVANKLAVAAKANMRQIATCDLAADAGTTCATTFVTAFGMKAYRRPLQAAEITKYVSLYTVGRMAPEGAANGFRLVVEAFLQSPFFLYKHDVGTTGAVQPGTVPLTPYELATRLSYFLWGSMPDASLFSLAANGTLTQEAVISAQVERMINDAKATATIGSFHKQWLGIEALPAEIRDPGFYPTYSPQLASAMLDETTMFADFVIKKGDGLLRTLLTSNMAFPQGGLFGVYGVTQPAGFTVGTGVMLPASQRAGLLTQAAFLGRWAHPTQTSPVHRGKQIRTSLLCQTIPAPPNNANTTPPPVAPATSTRERFAQHLADTACAACHVYMDPIGLGFEHYDAIGAYRTMDGLGTVDATGNIINAGPDLVGNFNGAVELANKLAQSQDVANCVSNQWFRFSLGRMETQNDVCSVSGIREAFRSSGGNIRELLARIALSPAFRHVRLMPGS
jgi:Protein of unknown function (DUF1592)/Protein of unknown function (DUF1588)/Protein of unknown function (DUF1585)/Protein of unknown function (DUF1595)/Protein of unknown function (DUF1587)